MEYWLLRLPVNILACLWLTVNFLAFLRLTVIIFFHYGKQELLNINCYCSKKLNIKFHCFKTY